MDLSRFSRESRANISITNERNLSETCRSVLLDKIALRTSLIDLYLVCFEAPDTVLIERAAGKRIDPETQGLFS